MLHTHTRLLLVCAGRHWPCHPVPNPSGLQPHCHTHHAGTRPALQLPAPTLRRKPPLPSRCTRTARLHCCRTALDPAWPTPCLPTPLAAAPSPVLVRPAAARGEQRRPGKPCTCMQRRGVPTGCTARNGAPTAEFPHRTVKPPPPVGRVACNRDRSAGCAVHCYLQTRRLFRVAKAMCPACPTHLLPPSPCPCCSR